MISNGMVDSDGIVDAKAAILAVAERLARIGLLSIEACSASASGWAGRGRGRVRVTHAADDAIDFEENGRFEAEDGRAALAFRNLLRWTVEPDRIVLAHRRHGPAAGTRLVELRPQRIGPAEAGLVGIEPHRCGADRYQATLKLAGDGFDMVWRVTGPRKDERLIHRYRLA
ncbi:MAG: hypothetical protein KGY53_00780 [Wenzhouxiangellaceae bacterium]|nr:hypothetical protein [Wenzhouxiangellaceae bacterium]